MTSPTPDDTAAFWDFFKDDIANAPVLTAAELGEHSMRSHIHRNDPPRVDGQHYNGCPCPVCVIVRAAQPTTHAIQAKHLSGASIGKLVEYEVGRNLTTGAHQWSPAGTLINVWHAEDSTEIAVDYDRVQDHADTYEQVGLNPDDWVRVTQPTGAPA